MINKTMPTYREIMKEVENATGRKIHHTCWVAEVKRHYGLTRGLAHNSGTGRGSPPCAEWAWNAIEQVLKNHGVI